MLDSVRIARRQSEIRQSLAALVGNASPSEDETRSMETLDAEYRSNETRYRAALIAEDTERREAGADLETRSDRDWSDLVARFELRQVAFALDEGRALAGATAEVVQEMRGVGGYQGVNSPPPAGAVFGWQTTELGNVGGPNPYETGEVSLNPDHTGGAQMVISRKALMQACQGLEAAIRRDLSAVIGAELDRVVINGTGATGQPLGIIPGASTYGIASTPVGAVAAEPGDYQAAGARGAAALGAAGSSAHGAADRRGSHPTSWAARSNWTLCDPRRRSTTAARRGRPAGL